MKLININKNYDKLNVLNNFNIEFYQNEICCLLGPSGCGKTTILNIISGITNYEGEIENCYSQISYIFQEQRLLPNLTVYNNLDYVLSAVEKDRAIRKLKILEILKKVELSEWQNAYPSQLSGGMAQRVAMARAFVYTAPLLLMDEPFKGLDISLKLKLISEFIRLWKNDKRTVIFVTHDIDEALFISNRIVILSKNAEILSDKRLNLSNSDRNLSEDSLIELRKEIYGKLI